ncbi:MAG: hypothetical protein QNJ98_07015 [Planctomycetota bacterium]|nr:hypothetical protein [Planctomycetota bacterium]
MPRILRTLLILLVIPTLLVWVVFGLPTAKADRDDVKTPPGVSVEEAPASVEPIREKGTVPAPEHPAGEPPLR